MLSDVIIALSRFVDMLHSHHAANIIFLSECKIEPLPYILRASVQCRQALVKFEFKSTSWTFFSLSAGCLQSLVRELDGTIAI